MPRYFFICWACETHSDEFRPISESSYRPKCEKCSEEMDRNYGAEHAGHVPGGTWPMTTTHLNNEGTPETFNSEKELLAACKARGIRHRPDAAFIESRMEMEKYREKDGTWSMRPTYKDGVGDGERGRRWF